MLKNKYSVEINNFNVEDDSSIYFVDGLSITDSSIQRNGTRYDIESMDISEYSGILTANHSHNIEDVIGKVDGIFKSKDAVKINKIKFAVKTNALAKFAYNMVKEGFIKDLSIETYGEPPNEDGVYKNSKLIGLSLVVTGNNRSARINEIALNSLNEAKKEGLNTASLQNFIIYQYNNMEEQNEAKSQNDLKTVVMEALQPVLAKVNELEQKIIDNKAKEPEFVSTKSSIAFVENKYANMGWMERTQLQFNSYLAKKEDVLYDVNSFHVEELKRAGIINNAMSIADFGNFVIAPELLKEIQSKRSDYTPLYSALNFTETLSTQFAWLSRDGDIDMQPVAYMDDSAGSNLKSVSEYGATAQVAYLEELAAVTPVCTSATRFLAVDILPDIARGYRTDYERKLSQLFIARLQQAVNATGQKVSFNLSTDIKAVKSVVDLFVSVSEQVPGGTFIFNRKTWGQLAKALIGSSISPVNSNFWEGGVLPILGIPYIVVPNELMPSLNSTETKSFIVDGSTVVINQSIFYVDLNTFTGRVSGGLQYDMSTEASYEVSGTVKSAYQRNELVLRGSFFRGGAIMDNTRVSSMGAIAIS